MKKITFCLILISCFSCRKTLDVGPLDVISEEIVWNDEKLVEAYFSNLYNNAGLIYKVDGPLNPDYLGGYHGTSIMGGEATNRQSWTTNYTDGRLAGDDTGIPIGKWNYGYIREVNTAIERLSSNGSLPENFVDQKLGEAHFFRACAYFELVKRYGGVPLIKKVQDVNAPIESLKVPRSTEVEVYDFILEDLKEAYAQLLGKEISISQVSEWSVLALLSRAMLYAGSIAQFNDQLPMKDDQGLVGISTDKAKAYYEESLEASRKLIELSPFRLKMTEPDLVSNFRNLFITPNEEIIMEMEFTGISGRHNNLEVFIHPRVTAYEYWGNMISPYLENVEAFQYRDGSSGAVLYGTNQTFRSAFQQGKFYSLEELFGQKDYRMQASICLPQTQYINEPIYYHIGVTDAEYATNKGVPLKCQNQNTGPNKGHTGLGQLKFLAGKPFFLGEGDTDVPIFRLGEIYLNFAEAALGLQKELDLGLKYVNELRSRGGLSALDQLTFEDIVQERRVELMFEHHRYWDLRRWRRAEAELNKNYNGVDWIWDVEQDKYQLTMKQNVEHWNRQFRPQHYYFPIPQSVVRDDDLKQNPGYEF